MRELLIIKIVFKKMRLTNKPLFVLSLLIIIGLLYNSYKKGREDFVNAR